MLSKAKISLINSLQIKKYRDINKLFIAEGEKLIHEVLNSDYKIELLFCTDDILLKNIKNNLNSDNVFIISEREMRKISQFKTPSKIFAVIKYKSFDFNMSLLKNKLSLFFEDIQNPGNLGTIVRLCDWFGIENILLSETSVDLYSPKVIQASMGSFTRVKVHYQNPETLISDYKNLCKHTCYGTFMEGENIYNTELKNEGLVCFGNEGSGISKKTEKLIDRKIFIPHFSELKTCESLNIASAAAIVCSEFRRRN